MFFFFTIFQVKFDEDFTRKLSEVGLVLIIIAGRWILPRGPITRDQLSALLLEYVAIAADILEIFESFEEKEVRTDSRLVPGVPVRAGETRSSLYDDSSQASFTPSANNIIDFSSNQIKLKKLK